MTIQNRKAKIEPTKTKIGVLYFFSTHPGRRFYFRQEQCVTWQGMPLDGLTLTDFEDFFCQINQP
jgi:hypothetical protein